MFIILAAKVIRESILIAAMKIYKAVMTHKKIIHRSPIQIKYAKIEST